MIRVTSNCQWAFCRSCSCTWLNFMNAQCIDSWSMCSKMHVFGDHLSRVATSLRMIWLWGFICICHCSINWFMVVHSWGKRGRERRGDEEWWSRLHCYVNRNTMQGHPYSLCYIYIAFHWEHMDVHNSFRCLCTASLCSPHATFWPWSRPSSC